MIHAVIFWVITLCSLEMFRYLLDGSTSWERTDDSTKVLVKLMLKWQQ
jgi:hypothetical protein